MSGTTDSKGGQRQEPGRSAKGNSRHGKGAQGGRPKGAAPSGSGNRSADNGCKPRPPRTRSSREVALDTLVKVSESGAYSNLQLNRALQEAQLSRPDAALATELVYGTIQRQRTLDDVLMRLVTKGWDKLAPWVLQLLRLSAYQLLYLDRIPAHAAVNEGVQIAKKRGHAGISGMVNGVLRNLERRLTELKELPGSQSKKPEQRIGITHSYPDWIVKRWISRYGESVAEAMCEAGNEPPHISIRLNPLRATRDEALELLKEEGFYALPSELAPHGIVIGGGGNLALTEGYAKGKWSLQDESSMLVAEVCAPQPGSRVLDCCAAPGGKATHLAELMGNKGTVIANDVHAHKRQLIADQAARLGLSAVEPVTGDAAELASRYEAASFDVVLLDAPCSGLGVIRRKPEIKWTKSPADIAAIAAIQKSLLQEASSLVKPGGTLVYSTCTIAPEENEDQVAQFLAVHPEFELDADWPEEVLTRLRAAEIVDASFQGAVQLLPQQFGSDGFYIARLKRKG